MEEDTKKLLRTHFNLRNTRSKALRNIIQNYKALSSNEIYNRLLARYKQETAQYLASFNGIIKESQDPNPVIIPPSYVKSLAEYNKEIKAQLSNLFNTIRESPPAPLWFRVFSNGDPPITIEETQTTPNRILLENMDFTPYIVLTPINQPVNTQPILLYQPPPIQDATNSQYVLPVPNLCVYNEILAICRKKGGKNMDDLIETTVRNRDDVKLYKTFTNGNLIIPVQEVEVNRENIMKYGVNEELLMRLCDALNLQVNLFKYGYETDNFKLTKQTNNGNTEKKALNCIVDNNHLYLLRDINTIRKFNKTIQDTTTPKSKHKSVVKEYVFNSENLTNIEFIKKAPHLPSQIYITNGILSPFVIEGIKYISNINNDLLHHKGCKYTGETSQSIAHEYLNQIPTSFMNESIFKALNASNVKHRTHADTLNEKCFIDGLPNPTLDIKKYDLNRAYAYAMENLQSLYTLNITSELIPYDRVDGAGLYYAIPSDGAILHGANFYTDSILNYAFSQGETFTITHKISVCTKPNTFQEIIKNIRADYPDHINKHIINSLSGLCGIVETDIVKCKLTTDTNKIMDFLNTAVNPYVKCENDVYFYGYKKQKNKYSNRLIQYIQILDEFNILAHQRAIGTGGKIIARNIDAFYVLNPTNNDHLSNKIGDYKHEQFKKLKNHKKNRDVVLYYEPIQSAQINIRDSGDLREEHIQNGLMILGIGGTGKTTAVKRLLQNKKAIIIAPTNISALNIGGITIHKYFSIDIEKNTANYPIINDEEYLVIEEASMITEDLWIHILQFKQLNKHLKVIILGDPHQLPSVEDLKYDFSKTYSILTLVNGHYTEFTKNYRQDSEGVHISEQLIEGIIPNFPISSKNYDGVNICFFNKTRQNINKELNGTKGFKIRLNEEEIVFGYLREGVPIICNKTKKDVFMNGESKIVSYLNNLDIIIFTDGSQITKEDFSHYFTLNYAITVYKAQGKTYDGIVNIHDIRKMCKNYRFIYTAISRATQYQNIRFQ